MAEHNTFAAEMKKPACGAEASAGGPGDSLVVGNPCDFRGFKPQAPANQAKAVRRPKYTFPPISRNNASTTNPHSETVGMGTKLGSHMI